MEAFRGAVFAEERREIRSLDGGQESARHFRIAGRGGRGDADRFVDVGGELLVDRVALLGQEPVVLIVGIEIFQLVFDEADCEIKCRLFIPSERIIAISFFCSKILIVIEAVKLNKQKISTTELII